MQQAPITKYRPFPPIDLPDRRWPSRTIQQAPIWCSVDLRDGNQALAIPMSVAEKLDYFDLLVGLGFKEIEVGFPSASETEFEFLRRLIDEDRIPEDVCVQVLVQAREHLIRRTFESLEGVGRAIVHLYNSTSPAQRRITFGKSKEEIKAIAVSGAELVQSLLSAASGSEIRLQYSPESFSSTEVDYSLEICEAVLDVWRASPEKPVILNLPATVEVSTPNVHADQIEWFCRHLKDRRRAIISLHTHNDRGCGVAATELGLMAGADRVEGTLFGNGERTGNLDLVSVALNLYTQGVHPGLDFSDLPGIRQTYERLTRMEVHPRHPYAGDLVFTAFSGSHQDAIKKGMDTRDREVAQSAEATKDAHFWEVPYLPIDPQDIGRSYEAIIRINSQSGKGGIAFVLAQDYGLDLPKAMQMEVGETISKVADKQGRELSNPEIYSEFLRHFAQLETPLKLQRHRLRGQEESEDVELQAEVLWEGRSKTINGRGNGPINALVYAIEEQGWKNFRLTDYRQHAIGAGSSTQSAAYIQLQRLEDGANFYGCGIDSNIERASLLAVVSAFNRTR